MRIVGEEVEEPEVTVRIYVFAETYKDAYQYVLETFRFSKTLKLNNHIVIIETDSIEGTRHLAGKQIWPSDVTWFVPRCDRGRYWLEIVAEVARRSLTWPLDIV